MEPKYHSGDVALIKKTGYDFDGLVYAVVYNEETYIKKSFSRRKYSSSSFY